jgi:hypothetical protein
MRSCKSVLKSLISTVYSAVSGQARRSIDFDGAPGPGFFFLDDIFTVSLG